MKCYALSEKPVRTLLIAALLAIMVVGVSPAHAASFTVNTTGDTSDANTGDGACADASGDCSLRAAIEEANALAGADDITVPAGTYTLTAASGGFLNVTSEITINGASMSTTIIQASTCNPVTLPGGCTPATYRVLASTGGPLYLNNLTIRHGNSSANGGGIFNFEGQIDITNSMISANSTANRGGGIFNTPKTSFGIVTLTNSTISGNSALSGGGIANMILDLDTPTQPVACTIDKSTINGNSATNGGGIYSNDGFTFITITNSTISGNSATTGGGIYLPVCDLGFNIKNTTVSGNSATTGGGIYITNSPIAVINTLVANNTGSDCFFSGLTANSYTGSLAGDGSCPGWGSITPVVDYTTTLANNGGPTQTHALIDHPTNPAIDAGGGCGLATDQRHASRDGACDIGAYEVGGIFGDGFESGNISVWSSSVS